MKQSMAWIAIGCAVILAAGTAMAQGPGRGLRPPAGGAADTSFFENKPLAANDAERKALEVIQDLFENQRRGMMNVPPDDGRLLRVLAESMNAKHVVEIGTSNGYSGLWFCLALRVTGGKLTTFEIDAGRARLARENFKRAGVENLVTLVEGDAHDKVSAIEGAIDLLFLDADKEGYLDYLEKLLPKVRAGGLIVAHNMNPSQADPRFIKAITTNPALETILVNATGTGVGISLKKR